MNEKPEPVQFFIMREGRPLLVTRELTEGETLAIQKLSRDDPNNKAGAIMMILATSSVAAFVGSLVMSLIAKDLIVQAVGWSILIAGLLGGSWWHLKAIYGPEKTLAALRTNGILLDEHADLHQRFVTEIRAELIRRDLPWTDEEIAEAMSHLRMYISLVETAHHRATHDETAPDFDDEMPRKMAKAIVQAELDHQEARKKRM